MTTMRMYFIDIDPETILMIDTCTYCHANYIIDPMKMITVVFFHHSAESRLRKMWHGPRFAWGSIAESNVCGRLVFTYTLFATMHL